MKHSPVPGIDGCRASISRDAVYDALGFVSGGDAARANPHHQERIVSDLAKLTDFLGELGVINDGSRSEWVERGLAA